MQIQTIRKFSATVESQIPLQLHNQEQQQIRMYE